MEVNDRRTERTDYISIRDKGIRFDGRDNADVDRLHNRMGEGVDSLKQRTDRRQTDDLDTDSEIQNQIPVSDEIILADKVGATVFQHHCR